MSSWEKLLEIPPIGGHFVQLYGSDLDLLVSNVGRYLFEGFQAGQTLLVVATPLHTAAFSDALSALGLDPTCAIRDERLVFLDAKKTLDSFMIDGQPDGNEFENCVGNVVRQVQSRCQFGLRAYGEMVSLLWTGGHFSAAMALEELWNKLIASSAFNLFCAYDIDVFGHGFHACDVDALLSSHTHLVPAQTHGDLEDAVQLAMQEILGSQFGSLKERIESDRQAPWTSALRGESLILALRKSVGSAADPILDRAREHYHNTSSQRVA